MKHTFGKLACCVLFLATVPTRDSSPSSRSLDRCLELGIGHGSLTKQELRGVAREGGINRDPWREFEYYSLLSATKSLVNFPRIPNADYIDTPIIATGTSRNRQQFSVLDRARLLGLLALQIWEC